MNQILLNVLFYLLLVMNVLSVGIALFSIKGRKKNEESYLKFSVFTTFGIYTSVLLIWAVELTPKILNEPIISRYFLFIPATILVIMLALKLCALTESRPKSNLKVEEKS